MANKPFSGKHLLAKIKQLEIPNKLKILNVCGGHERSISNAGLRSLLPEHIELIPGPGCPVCICPEQDVHEAIQLALDENIIMLAFGDMLRVPVNAPKSEPRSLEQAKTLGADIRPVASPIEALNIATENPLHTIVFFAAGFETTMAPVAAMLAQKAPANLLVLLSGRLTWPAVLLLLQSQQQNFDALIAPGHVATVMGSQEWDFVVTQYKIPVAVAGFTPDSLLAAFYSVIRQTLEHKCFLDNCYSEVVSPSGNRTAQNILNQVMKVVDADWRGIGEIKDSGFALQAEYQNHDARQFFKPHLKQKRTREGEMPPGCDCASVIMGQIYPSGCRLYGTACKPESPIGPCMVSDEGACRIWWANSIRSDTIVMS